MSGVSVSVAMDNIVAGEMDITFRPRGGCRGRRPIFLFHGQLRPAGDWNNFEGAYGSTTLAWALARAGFVVIAGYWMGPQWGNATFRALFDTPTSPARAYATSLGAASDKFIGVGASMGAFECFSLAQHIPTQIACGVGLIPGVDLDDFRDNNYANARNYINTAYGLAAGSTSATVPLPADANPYAPANAAQITAPFRLYGSSADTTASWTKLVTMVNSRMVNCSDKDAVDVSSAGHTEDTIAAAPVDTICKFVQAHAA